MLTIAERRRLLVSMVRNIVKRVLVGDSAAGRIIRSYVVLPYVVLTLFAFFISDSMIFVPQQSSYKDGPEVHKIEVDNGQCISAVYLSEPNAEFTILYSHGNAEDIGHVRPILERFKNMGFSVFAYDYRGYGTSDGRASARNSYEDIEAAYGYLVERLGVSANRIIVMGRSIGGGPAIELATKNNVAGLICESCFVSAYRVLTRVPILPFDKFRNLNKIKKINCPVLIIHGQSDRIVPIWHGRRLFEAASEPKFCLWVDGAGHNDDIAVIAGEDYWQVITKFKQSIRCY